MKQEEVTRLLQQLNLPKNKYLHTKKIKSIKLKSGREIKFNSEGIRISFLDKTMKIQYGSSSLYGARLENVLYLGSDYRTVVCRSLSTKFRDIREMDVLVSSQNGRVLSNSYITKILRASNQIILYLSNQVSPSGRLSFYDPEQYSQNDGYCIHGTEIEGIYTKFKPNLETISKKEIIHEIVKYKNIKEIIIEEGII